MANEGLHIFYNLSRSFYEETKKKFKLRKNQFDVQVMGYSGAIVLPDEEGLKYLAKSQKYEFHSTGVLRIKISYHGFKINHDQSFILTNRGSKIFMFMAESGPDIKMNPRKMPATRVSISILRHILMSVFDHFKEKGMRMHLCSAKVPLSSLHYYIVPLN